MRACFLTPPLFPSRFCCQEIYALLASTQRCEHSLLSIMNAGLPGLLGSTDHFKLQAQVLLCAECRSGRAERQDLGTGSQVRRLFIGMIEN